MRGKDLVFTHYPTRRNIEEIATKATNQGVYTIDSEIRTVHYFFEDNKMVIGTPNGHVKMSIDRAETIAQELVEIIPEVRQHARSGRKIMDSRAITKMLEGDSE